MGIRSNKARENKNRSVSKNETSPNNHPKSGILAQNPTHNADRLQHAVNTSQLAIQLATLPEVANRSSNGTQVAQLQQIADHYALQQEPLPIINVNHTGIPDQLKAGLESLSGYAMDDLRVHYNSNKPAQLQALAYAQGTNIYLATGQEKHLPHEAWHVVQQKQGRVTPTLQMKGGFNVNSDPELEKEATIMGERALGVTVRNDLNPIMNEHKEGSAVVQRMGTLSSYLIKKFDEAFPEVYEEFKGTFEATDTQDVNETGSKEFFNAYRAIIKEIRAVNFEDAVAIAEKFHLTIGNDMDLVEQFGGSNGMGVTVVLGAIVKSVKVLDEDESKMVKTMLSPGKGEDISELEEGVLDDPFDELVTLLDKTAELGLERYNSTRNKDADLSKDTPMYGVLQLAITKIKSKYGAVLDETLKLGAASILATDSDKIVLHQPDDRWKEYKDNEDTIREEAAAAAQYMVDTDADVQACIKDVLAPNHKENLASVEQAYLAAVSAKAPMEVLSRLAEYRVRWSPLTDGSDIFIEMPKEEGNTNARRFMAWTQYKYLVHEVMHTAAHPNFEKYLKENAPAEVRNTVLEGCVDFFAQTVWMDIIGALQANTDNVEIKAIHDVLANNASSKVSGTFLGTLRNYKDQPLYTAQVPIIEGIIQALQGGEARLIDAFFFGKTDHFFPKY